MAVEVEHAHRMVQFGGQLHAGGAAADNGHGHRLAFVVGVQAGIEEAFAEALRLGAAIHEQAVVAHPGGAEIVALAAGGQHQVVVVQRALGQHFLAVFIKQGGQRQALACHIHLGHGAGLETVVVELGVGAVVHRIQVRVNGAGGYFVKTGFPHMDTGGIHQGDVLRYRCGPAYDRAW